MRRLLSQIRRRLEAADAPFVPPGHFYSPIVDTRAVAAERERLWPSRPVIAGIDWNDAGHRRILTEAFPRFLPLYDYPEVLPDGPNLAEFYTRNTQFSWLDARALFVLLHEWRPRRIIEVGSGYSSLLVADVNRRWFDNAMHVTCIEPYPRPFLANRIPGISRLVEEKVQHVPVDAFGALMAGDMLFIDSSHVAKTGSDVNRLYFDVLPALAPGVRIHIHDIFLPHDYPQSWVIDENRSWNEQYLVHALLIYSKGFRVEFGCAYAFHAFPDLVVKALAHPRGRGYGGGSLWLTKLNGSAED
ncbi:MAG: class I SAM-dependent methyltransferase [Betaproteobacteria bacterium]